MLLVLHPSGIQLQADMVGLFALDGKGHLIDALRRDVGGADEENLLAILKGQADAGITQLLDGHAVNYTEDGQQKQGNLTCSVSLE